MVAEEGEERHNAVAEGNTLKDGPDAEMTKTEQVSLYSVIEPIDEKSDGEEQHRTLDNATDDLRCGHEFRLHQGEVARDSHDEEEEGKDEVTGSHTVPL